MATQTGYKTSELGEVLNPILNKKVSESFFTFIGMQDVSEEAKIINQTILPISQLRSGLTYFEKNDVLVAKITPCFENGKGGYANNLKTEIGFGSTEFHILRANQRADAEFIYYWTINPKFRQQLTLDMVGSAGHKRVPFQALHKFKISLPPLPEQTAIATALSDTDALIGSLKTLIAKKKAIKLSAMQNLLSGKIRLPEFALRPDRSPKTTHQTELGLLPEDWEIHRVGDFTDCTAGGTPSTQVSSYWGGEIPWMSSGELHLKQVYNVAGRITQKGLENSSTKFVPANSVLIGLAGQGKTRGTVAISKISLCTNQSIAAIFPTDEFNSTFLFYNLENRYDELRALSTGDGGRGGLNLTIIRNVLVKFPSLPEQAAIAQLLSDIDAEIEALEGRLKKTQSLKQGMMQALLTGKIRLPLE